MTKFQLLLYSNKLLIFVFFIINSAFFLSSCIFQSSDKQVKELSVDINSYYYFNKNKVYKYIPHSKIDPIIYVVAYDTAYYGSDSTIAIKSYYQNKHLIYPYSVTIVRLTKSRSFTVAYSIYSRDSLGGYNIVFTEIKKDNQLKRIIKKGNKRRFEYQLSNFKSRIPDYKYKSISTFIGREFPIYFNGKMNESILFIDSSSIEALDGKSINFVQKNFYSKGIGLTKIIRSNKSDKSVHNLNKIIDLNEFKKKLKQRF